MRAKSSGRHLDKDDASLVKGMIDRGDRQHDIASVFAVNGGRIGETSTGENFSGVSAAASDLLPPPAPYLVVEARHNRKLKAVRHKLENLGASSDVLSSIDEIIAAFNASEHWRDFK